MKTASQDTINPDAFYWASFNCLQLRLPGQCVLDCSHSGACDDDVAYWAPRIRELTAGLYAGDESNPWNPTSDAIRLELKECGAWDAEELADDEENWRRLVWIAANDIADSDEPDCSEPVRKEVAK